MCKEDKTISGFRHSFYAAMLREEPLPRHRWMTWLLHWSKPNFHLFPCTMPVKPYRSMGLLIQDQPVSLQQWRQLSASATQSSVMSRSPSGLHPASELRPPVTCHYLSGDQPSTWLHTCLSHPHCAHQRASLPPLTSPLQSGAWAVAVNQEVRGASASGRIIIVHRRWFLHSKVISSALRKHASICQGVMRGR